MKTQNQNTKTFRKDCYLHFLLSPNIIHMLVLVLPGTSCKTAAKTTPAFSLANEKPTYRVRTENKDQVNPKWQGRHCSVI